MNTEELLMQVRLTYLQHRARFGQALFAQACDVSAELSDLCESLVGTPDDPYEATSEHDPRVQNLVARIREVIG